MKLLLWGLIVLAVLWLLRSKKGAGGAPASGGRPAGNGAETMIQCAHCGVYVPASESVSAASGMAYCSEEHRLRHAS